MILDLTRLINNDYPGGNHFHLCRRSTRIVKFWTNKVGFEVKANHPLDPNANWIELGPPSSLQSVEVQPCRSIVIYPRYMMSNWRELKPSIVFSNGSKDQNLVVAMV